MNDQTVSGFLLCTTREFKQILNAPASLTQVPFRCTRVVADHGNDLSAGIARFQQEHAPSCIHTYYISHRLAALLKEKLSGYAR